ERVFVVYAVVEPSAESLASIGSGSDRSESGYGRKVWLDYVDSELICVFEISEEERLVLLYRSANPEARLAPRKKRIVGERVPVETRISAHVVIAKIKVSCAVIVVASRARDDVDRTKGGDAGRQIEVCARELKLLDDFLGEVLSGTAFDRISDVPAVHGDRGVRGGGAPHPKAGRPPALCRAGRGAPRARPALGHARADRPARRARV